MQGSYSTGGRYRAANQNRGTRGSFSEDQEFAFSEISVLMIHMQNFSAGKS
jgi:hypothetical protein